MSRGCQDRLLCIGQQPCARLGPRRPAGDADCSAQKLNVKATGAGRNDQEARAPAVLNLAKARLLIFSFGSTSSGIPFGWAATPDAPGVNLLPDLCEVSALQVANQVMALRRPGDLIVVSIHWGSNWGYHIPDEQKVFARALIDQAGVSIVHGHSSHHPRAIVIYRDRLILYGCGDFLNDYEWIRNTLDGECQQFGTRVIFDAERQLAIVGQRATT